MNPELVRQVTRVQKQVDNLVIPEKGRALIDTYLRLSGIRFFAPMSAIGASGQAVDLALGNSLANNNNADFLFDGLAPYCRYNGSTQYHNIADTAAHDILGSEAYVAASGQGLTMGMWCYPITLPGTTARIFSKGATTGNARAYALAQTAANAFNFTVSGNGTNTFGASDGTAFTASTWHFVAGRFDPSTEVKVYVGRKTGITSVSFTTSIPATINNSATGLAIGAQADGTQFSNIRASCCFICAEMLSDGQIGELFEATRGTFGI